MSRRLIAALYGLVLLVAAAVPMTAVAVRPDEILTDPALEARARNISKELRCLVCQNESIDESHADLARDLRLLVRQRLLAGDTDRQVIAYVHERYGDFVLLRPPVRGTTLVLWFGPGVLLALVVALVWRQTRRRRAGIPHQGGAAPEALTPETLTPEEQAELDRLLAARAARTGDAPSNGKA